MFLPRPCLFLILFLLLSHVSAANLLWFSSVNREITDLAMPGDGSRILLAAEWVHSFTPTGTLSWKQWNARRIACSSDGRYIAAGTSGLVSLVDRTGRKLWDRNMDGELTALAISADGSRIAAGTPDGLLSFYDNSGELLNETTAGWRSPYPPVRDLSIAANGRYTAVVSSRAAYLYNYTGHLLWEELNTTFLDGRFVALDARGQELAIAGTFELYSLHSGGEELWVHRPNAQITALARSQDGSTLALGTADGRVILLDRDGTVTGTLTSGGRISDLALSRDGSRVLAGSWDRTVSLLDRNATLLDSLELPERVNHVAITADGTTGAAATREAVYAFTTLPSTSYTLPTTLLTTLPTTAPDTPAPSAPETLFPPSPTPPPTTQGLPGIVLIPVIAMVLFFLWRR